jgi:hypothetical protein
MIADVIVRKSSSDDPPRFHVGYFDLERSDETGYFGTTEYGTEKQMRELLKSHGVSEAEIDALFERAKF